MNKQFSIQERRQPSGVERGDGREGELQVRPFLRLRPKDLYRSVS
jgi:hypothetical protein